MDFEAFYNAPNAAALGSCTKEQLVEIAKHYSIDFEDDVLKDQLKADVIITLHERGVLPRRAGGAVAEPLDVLSQSPVKHEGLTFEQQRSLLEYQERLIRLQLEVGKNNIELENAKLRVLRESAALGAGGSGSGRENSEGSSNLRYVPKFNERDPDTFFTLFERVAAARSWPDAERILLLQCVLTGKAQEAYSAVCAQENLTYDGVKSAVLKAYQLTAEAYRQRFRQWVKQKRQTHVEFVNELTTHFKRWCSAAGVSTFEKLSDLIILEQFKYALPGQVVTYLNEREPDSVVKAAQLADDFALTHQCFGSAVRPVSGGESGSAGAVDSKADVVRNSPGRQGRSRDGDVCHYCRNVGHWKDKCPLLERKGGASAAMLCVDAPHQKMETTVESGRSGFEPFITTARVSLAGSSEYVNVKVLRDTGAMHSFMIESVLPFSCGSQVGDFILMRGMELGCVPVPRHRVALECDFVSGVFPVAVRPALPVEGVGMILGNDICGSYVFASGPPSPVVVSKPFTSDLVSGIENEIVPVCVVTRAQAKRAEPVVDVPASVGMPLLPVAVAKEDWVETLQTNGSISSFQERVVSQAQIRDLAQGYCELDSMLVRKWSGCDGDLVSEPRVQLDDCETPVVECVAQNELLAQRNSVDVGLEAEADALAWLPPLCALFQVQYLELLESGPDLWHWFGALGLWKSTQLCFVDLLRKFYLCSVGGSGVELGLFPGLVVEASVFVVFPLSEWIRLVKFVWSGGGLWSFASVGAHVCQVSWRFVLSGHFVLSGGQPCWGLCCPSPGGGGV